MSKEDRMKSGFLLPDLLGKPLGLTDKDGNMIFLLEQTIPPDSFIFFIPTMEWKEYTSKRDRDEHNST